MYLPPVLRLVQVRNQRKLKRRIPRKEVPSNPAVVEQLSPPFLKLQLQLQLQFHRLPLHLWLWSPR
jgi:hypothetical protein